MTINPALSLSLTCLLTTLLVGCHDSGSSDIPPPSVGNVEGPDAPTHVDCAVARVVSSESDLVPGPLARGTLGDIVLENNRLRAIIQKGGRNWFNIGQFGGNIIDAVPKNAAGALAAEDHYEEASLGTNIESSPNYQSVEIVNPGGKDAEGNCVPAVVRAVGPDDLLDFVNGSSAIRTMGFSFPPSADDVDLPVTIQTHYTLDINQRAITMASTLQNESPEDLQIYLTEYANGSGEVELFQYGYGFGEALITAPCDSCRSIIYSGHEGGSGVSYGIVHNVPRTTTLSVSGVTVLVYGTDTLPLAAVPEPLNQTVEPPPFTVPGDGEFTFTRWFVVGTGSVASVLDTQYQLLDIATGKVTGRVFDSNGPVVGAEISVITQKNDFNPIAPGALPFLPPNIPGTRGPDTIVANQFRTDANGFYHGTLPPGDYELRLNVPGRGAPIEQSSHFTLQAGATVVENFQATEAAGLRVLVVDENNHPIPAKVQLIGVDTSPDAGEPQNSESVLGGVLTLESGIFGDFNADKLANGIVLSEFAVADPNKSGPVIIGDTGLLDVQPGTFELSVSRGPRYSEFRQSVTLEANKTQTLTAKLIKVVDTPNLLLADFHVHSFNSPDSEVTNRERVITYLAEDMDFFTPSDHGYRADFEPVIADMQVGRYLASTPSAEVTTFDYGHFNAWPVRIEQIPAHSDEASQSSDLKISRGATDWGRPAPAGKDFPSQNQFGQSPAEIFEEMKRDPVADGRDVVVQINHIDSHFGAEGLAIDTGAVGAPQSGAAPASKRLAPGLGNLFSDSFDSLELWIGVDGLDHQTEKFLGQNLGDWFNLLNRGILKTFVANSDTHDRRLTSLSTRNYISVPSVISNQSADTEKLRASVHDVGDAVIEGHTTGSNSLFMTVSAKNSLGQIAGLEQSRVAGTKSKPLAGGLIELTIDIKAPAWAEYDEIAIFINSPTTRHKDQLGQPTTPARYSVCQPTHTLTLGADFSRSAETVDTVNGVAVQRLKTSVALDNLSLSQDSWMVVVARGTQGISRPLWPVVPNDFEDSDGLNNRSAADVGTLAMAVSNPLYFDVDGGGWQAPNVPIASSCTAYQ